MLIPVKACSSFPRNLTDIRPRDNLSLCTVSRRNGKKYSSIKLYEIEGITFTIGKNVATLSIRPEAHGVNLNQKIRLEFDADPQRSIHTIYMQIGIGNRISNEDFVEITKYNRLSVASNVNIDENHTDAYLCVYMIALARKIGLQFPLVEGIILSSETSEIFLISAVEEIVHPGTLNVHSKVRFSNFYPLKTFYLMLHPHLQETVMQLVETVAHGERLIVNMLCPKMMIPVRMCQQALTTKIASPLMSPGQEQFIRHLDNTAEYLLTLEQCTTTIGRSVGYILWFLSSELQRKTIDDEMRQVRQFRNLSSCRMSDYVSLVGFKAFCGGPSARIISSWQFQATLFGRVRIYTDFMVVNGLPDSNAVCDRDLSRRILMHGKVLKSNLTVTWRLEIDLLSSQVISIREYIGHVIEPLSTYQCGAPIRHSRVRVAIPEVVSAQNFPLDTIEASQYRQMGISRCKEVWHAIGVEDQEIMLLKFSATDRVRVGAEPFLSHSESLLIGSDRDILPLFASFVEYRYPVAWLRLRCLLRSWNNMYPSERIRCAEQELLNRLQPSTIENLVQIFIKEADKDAETAHMVGEISDCWKHALFKNWLRKRLRQQNAVVGTLSYFGFAGYVRNFFQINEDLEDLEEQPSTLKCFQEFERFQNLD